MIRLCCELDNRGYYKASDMLFKRYIEAQWFPSNNLNSPIDTRVIPWKDIEEDFKQRDYDWFTKTPPLRKPEYISLPGVQEPPLYPADGGTSNIKPQVNKDIDYTRLNQMLAIYKTYPLNPDQKAKILEQIKNLVNKAKSGSGAGGSEFDMHGPDDVPGPKNIIIDHSSPSMMGLDGFTWQQRRDVYNNPDDSYKKLLPL